MILARIQRNKRIAGTAIACICLATGYALLPVKAPPAVPPESAPVIAATTAPLPTPEPKPATPQVTDGKSQTILELFSPSDPYLTQQLNETALSQQIEQIITTSFVLTKCNLITTEDYRDNFRALIVYAQHMHLAADAATAEATIRRLAESAGTSYSLVYSRTKCEDTTLPRIAQQLLNWQKAYLNQ